MQAVDNAVEPGKLKLPLSRLNARPDGIAHPDKGESGFFHQLNILLQPFNRQVLVIIRSSIKHVVQTGSCGENWNRSQEEKDQHEFQPEEVIFPASLMIAARKHGVTPFNPRDEAFGNGQEIGKE